MVAVTSMSSPSVGFALVSVIEHVPSAAVAHVVADSDSSAAESLELGTLSLSDVIAHWTRMFGWPVAGDPLTTFAVNVTVVSLVGSWQYDESFAVLVVNLP